MSGVPARLKSMSDELPRWVDLATSSSRWMRLRRTTLSGVGDVFPVVGGIAVIVERDAAADAERQVHLRRLIVLRHVRIEIVLAVPLGDFRRRAIDHQSGEQRFLDGLAVEHGQRAGQAEADRAGVGVGRVAERGAAGAEHLGVRFDLAVDFEADGDEVGHGG